jgi:hypothetical protein
MARSIHIDGTKLRGAFAAAKVNMAAASRECGFSQNYFSNCCGYCSISGAAAKLLEIKYGIMLRDYVYVEPEKPAEPAEEPKAEAMPAVAVDIKDLQQAFAVAMQNHAPEINYERLREVTREAVRDGILDAIYQANADKPTRDMVTGAMASAVTGGMLMAWRKKLEQSK